jgi:peptidoglycan LD-endopeptidase CwlK
MIFDSRTESNIKTLHPRVQKAARSFMSAACSICKQQGYEVKIISGTRTYAEQDALYAQGRTVAGKKVTNAKAGFSNHNFGIAFDIGIFQNKKYFGDHRLYDELGVLGESLGLVWGGRWKSFPDKPHFQANTGLTLAQMRHRVAANHDIFA